MSDFIPDILQFNISFIFIVLIFGFSAFISYVLYRKTNPDNTDIIKITLGALRTFLLLLIIILFFKPKVFYQFVQDIPQDVLLLIDHSASMGWKSELEDRPSERGKIISYIDENIGEYDVKVSKKYFNNTIFNYSDSLKQPFGATDFLNVMNHINNQKLDKVILISDGIRTAGRIPNNQSSVPLYAVGVGNSESNPDIFITNVDFKPVVYQGKEQLINVKISSRNISNKEVTATLFSGKTILNTSKIAIEKSGIEQELLFKTVPQQAGLTNYTIRINSDAEDLNHQNNQFVFTQEVVKSKIRVGIFTSIPNNEYKFLKLLLSKSEDIEVHSYLKILNKDVEPPYPLDSLDVIVLQGYPSTNTNSLEINKIFLSLEKQRQGLVIMLDDRTDPAKLKAFEKFLPFKKISKRNKVINAAVSMDNKTNVILRMYESVVENEAFFQEIPPVNVFFTLGEFSNSSIPLIKLESKGVNEKCLIINEQNNRKIIVYNGSGFWRWHFSLHNHTLYHNGFEKMLMNQVRWISGKNKFKAVVLDINKKSINPGQEIVLNGYLFDAQSNPIINGNMRVEATIGEQSFTINLTSDSTGKYFAAYTPITEGRYLFKAKGFEKTNELGQDTKALDVLPYNREFIQTNQDTAFLKQIAEESGGEYFDGESVHKLFAQMDLDPQKVKFEEETELNQKAWLMYLIIALAVVEWSFRKIKNLV